MHVRRNTMRPASGGTLPRLSTASPNRPVFSFVFPRIFVKFG